MVFPREQLLGAITELDENSSGFVTCHDAVIRNVAGYQNTARSLANKPVVGTSGIGIFWVEDPGGGNATLAKFTDSNNVTITLGQNLVTSVFGRTGDVVGSSNDIANDSSILAGAGSVTDALNALSSLGGENLEETLAIGNYTGNYDIQIDNARKIVGRTDGSTFEVTSKDNSATGSGSVTVRTGDYSAAGSGNIYLRSGNNPTGASGYVYLYSGDNAGTQTGEVTVRSGSGSNITGKVTVNTGTPTVSTGASGIVDIITGAGGTSSGGTYLRTGNAVNSSGQVTIGTGTAINSGNISVASGTATTLSGSLTLQTGANAITTGPLTITTGNATTTSGNVNIQTGTSSNASGYIFIRPNTAPNVGDLYLYTASGGDAGNIQIRTGMGNLPDVTATTTGNGGSIIIETTGGNGGISGDVSIATGASGTGRAGDIALTSGAANIDRAGDISFTTGGSAGGRAGNVQFNLGDTGSVSSGGSNFYVYAGDAVIPGGIPGEVFLYGGDHLSSAVRGNIYLEPGQGSSRYYGGGTWIGYNAHSKVGMLVDNYNCVNLEEHPDPGGSTYGFGFTASASEGDAILFKRYRALCWWDDANNIYDEITYTYYI